MDNIKKYWNKFIEILQKKVFVLTYPLMVFYLFAIATKNVLAIITLGVWVLVIIFNTDEDI